MLCFCSRHAESRRRKRKDEQKQDAADAGAEEMERATARQKHEEEAQLRAEGQHQGISLTVVDAVIVLQPCNVDLFNIAVRLVQPQEQLHAPVTVLLTVDLTEAEL